ncbi:hypothetical protein P2318_24520 [Myxococcaceae bacterium GXIMD 01537]
MVVIDPNSFTIAIEADSSFLPDVAHGNDRFLTVDGEGGSNEPPFNIQGKRAKHDTRVGPVMDLTREF